MTKANSLPLTVDESWLAMQAAGTLPPFKQLLLECQIDMRPEVLTAFEASDHIAGMLLESAKGAELSDGFMSGLADRIEQTTPEGSQPDAPQAPEDTDTPAWMPRPLAEYVHRSGRRVKWRRVGAGVQKARLGRTPAGHRLYLLRAHAGVPIPKHTHKGQEWTLLLSGGYKTGQQQYVAGDLHQEDETAMHDLRIDADGPCISLITDEGKLRFDSPFLNLLQPFLGL